MTEPITEPEHDRALRLLDSMPAAFFALDRSYRVTYLNRAAALLAGRPAEEAVGANVWDVFPLLADSEHREACRRAMEERETVALESTIGATDRRIACVAFPADDGLATYIRDVTEEHEARRQLAEAGARYRTIIENASDVVSLVDENANILFVTPASERMLGYAPDEMQGRSAFEFIHPDDHAVAVAKLSVLVEDPERTQSAEIRLRHKDGSWVWSESAGRNMLADPVIHAIIATHRDVSDRRRAEEALRASEERFRALIEGSADGVMVVDADARATYMGPAVTAMLGYEPDELIGASALDYVHPEDLPRALEALRALVEDERAMERVELRVRHKDGSWRWMETVGRNRTHNASVGGIVVNFRDITERKRTEEALRRADEERRYLLSRLVRAQEEERARIALDIHDDTLQTLTAFGMRVGMLKSALDDPEERRRLADVETTLAKAMQRLRTLLFELRPPPLDEQGIEVALDLHLAKQTRAAGIGYSLEARLDREPPPAVRVTLYRIAQEAVANVLRHAGASRVDVRLRSVAGGVEAEIRDDGVGFELSGDGISVTPGHLGLPAMRERAEIAGGWVRIETSPRRGTTVRVWLPVDPGERHGGGEAQG